MTVPKIARNKFFLGFLGLVIISTFYLVYSANRKKPEPITSIPLVESELPSKDVQNLSQSTVLFKSDQFPSLPEKITVFKTSTSTISLNQLAQKMANKFNLTPDPSKNGRWIDDKNTESLTVSNGKIIYQADFYASTAKYLGPAKPTLTTSKSNIQALFTEVADWKTLDSTKVEYLSGGGESALGNESNYDTLSISLADYLNSLPVFWENDYLSQVEARMGQNDQPVKITLNQLPLPPVTPGGEYSSLSLVEFNQQVQGKKITPIHYVLESPSKTPYPEFKEVQVSDIKLEYRYLNHLGLVVPFLRINGKSTVENIGAEVIFITPAISSSQLNTLISNP